MEGWSHKSENIKPKLEIGEQPGYHKAILVALGFEVKKTDLKKSFGHKKEPKKEHRTGLLWETRIKLLAAFLLWKAGEAERVVMDTMIHYIWNQLNTLLKQASEGYPSQ